MTNLSLEALEDIFWVDNETLWDEITGMRRRVENLRDVTLALATKYEKAGEWGMAETMLEAFLINSIAYEKFLSPRDIRSIRQRWETAKAKHKW